MAMLVPGGSRVAGVNGELVAECAQEDAALGEVVNQVQGLPHITAEPVQREQLYPVAGLGEAEQGGQAQASRHRPQRLPQLSHIRCCSGVDLHRNRIAC
jgi:hypothetical protein